MILRDAHLIWEAALVIATVIGAAVWLRSSLVKQGHAELLELAETRGERIEDLQAEIDELRKEMHEMRGEMKFLHEMKTKEIASAAAREVVIQLRPFLEGNY